jgi:hypothetical protein
MSASSLAVPTPDRPGPSHPRSARVTAWLRSAWAANPPLTLVGLATLALVIPFVVGIFADPRVITGAPAWLKPAKFAVSIGIYSLTLLWFLSFVRGHRRLVAAVAWGTALAFVLEMVIIAGQAGRGTTSHFNDATALDGALFSIMGGAILVVWLLGLATAVLLLRQRIAPASLAWALRLGILGAAVGMALALPMVGGLQAHAVGVADGGPGLPVVNWSTEGGDLRVGHFVGLHAMQVLPLLALALARFAPRWLPEGRRTALVVVAGLAWIGLALLLTWQALRAQSIVNPDGVTLGAFGALGVAAVVAAGAVVLPAARGAGVGGVR